MQIKGIYFVMLILSFWSSACKQAGSNDKPMQEVVVGFGAIENSISVTGTILPRNRLEIMPPVAGRIESIAVKEGDLAKKGDIVAWTSSTERAALLDAARGQDEQSRTRLENAYKPIALIAPIDGQVIVSRMQSGQSVTVSDAVVVLSDKLIIRALLDETDIAKAFIGQEANVTIDAYPDDMIKAHVEHIYYESETVNNVTTYKVDLITDNIPEFFKSGMNASIEFICDKKSDALLVPSGAVSNEGKDSFVLLKTGSNERLRQRVTRGISDDKNTEIISGLREGDIVLLKFRNYVLPKNDSGSNPFMPKRPSRQSNKSKP